MLAPQEVSIYLNNALKATPVMAEVDSDTPLPEVIREMPQEVSGRFVALDAGTAAEMAAAWKHIMRLNATPVIYDFSFDPSTQSFKARRR